jgi:hypothetical protein
VAEIVTAAELTLGLQKGVLEDLDDGVSSGWSGDGFKQESAQYLAQADPKSSRLVKKVCFLSQLCAILDPCVQCLQALLNYVGREQTRGGIN